MRSTECATESMREHRLCDALPRGSGHLHRVCDSRRPASHRTRPTGYRRATAHEPDVSAGFRTCGYGSCDPPRPMASRTCAQCTGWSSFPLTAAGQFRSCTGFPFNPASIDSGSRRSGHRPDTSYCVRWVPSTDYFVISSLQFSENQPRRGIRRVGQSRTPTRHALGTVAFVGRALDGPRVFFVHGLKHGVDRARPAAK